MNHGGEFHLFFGQIAVFIFFQQARQNQQAVERRAQFVRHVGKKFRFVFAGNLQIAGFLFDDKLRLSQGLIFFLQLRLLPLQCLRLLFQFFVGLPQFFLLLLQLLLRMAQCVGLRL